MKRQGRQGFAKRRKGNAVPFDNELTPYDLPEPSAEVDELARVVIGAAIEVHKALGAGHLEETYENALAIELESRGILFERQVAVDVIYKGKIVGKGKLDFLVAGRLIIEIKAVTALIAIHAVQVQSYLSATGLQLGLLINFNVLKLRDGGIRRIINSATKR